MDFNTKLQELRKQKQITQEQLANALFVSRTAVSKWESGRGYPSIESLKAIAIYFKISLDELLSSEDLLTIAEENSKQKENHFCDMLFGMLDCCISMLLFLPFFAQKYNGTLKEVSLLDLSEISPYLHIGYFFVVFGLIIFGILTLALQNLQKPFWMKNKRIISLILTSLGVIIFIISLQPYPAVFMFGFLIIKTLVLLKNQ